MAAGCANNTNSPVVEESPQPKPEMNSDVTGENTAEDEGSNMPKENPKHEWTEEEKGLLSIDTDKIVLLFKPDSGQMYTDDLPKLKNKYQDLELISTERTGASGRDEIWYSDFAGLSYLVYHWEIVLVDEGNLRVPSGEWHSMVQRIYGQSDSLVTGLIAPIKVEELMEAHSLAETDWAIGEGPESDRLSRVYHKSFFESSFFPDKNDLCIVIPQVPFPGAVELAVGIRIKMSMPGFVSPTDEFDIVDLTASP